MKKAASIVSIALMLMAGAPVRADFKYSEKASITGGALNGMVKALGVFNKETKEAMKPTVTTHYIKGNRLRTDQADGTIEIIDLDGHRIIQINPQMKTYSSATFEQIQAATQAAMQSAQQKLQQNPEYKNANVSATIKPTIQMSVSPGTQVVMGQEAKEVKGRIDTEFQATGTGDSSAANGSPAAAPASASGQPQQASATISFAFDMWVAPGVTSYQEFKEFYRKMAKEVNWTPPSNLKIDPRMQQSMKDLQASESTMQGFPLVQYLSMGMAATGATGTQDGSAQNAQPQAPPPPPPPSNDTMPTTASGALAKGFGGLFNKHKNQNQAQNQNQPQNQNQNPPAATQNPALPPPPSNPGSLMDLTVEVTSFSNATLDGSLFEIPAGYTEVQANPSALVVPQAAQ